MREVGPGIFQLAAGGKLVNVFYVEADVPVLVDAGGPRESGALLEELHDEGVEPKLVLLTHGDFDHFGGAAAVREEFGAPIAAPAAERPLLTGEIDRRWFASAASKYTRNASRLRAASTNIQLQSMSCASW